MLEEPAISKSVLKLFFLLFEDCGKEGLSPFCMSKYINVHEIRNSTS